MFDDMRKLAKSATNDSGNDTRRGEAELDSTASETYRYLLEKYKSATLTPTQFASEVHHHPSHIRALLQAGELPGSRIGTRWIIPTTKAASIIESSQI